MKNVKMLVTSLLVLVAAAALIACGSDESTTAAEEETVSGKLALLEDAPPGYSKVAGEATLTRSDGGTTVSLAASGLQPDTPYIAHLHVGGCEQADPGGPHFQFEPGGSEEPPNEIHLELTSDAAGEGEAQATSKREVPIGEAGSIVLHAAESHNKTAAFDPAAAGAVTTVFVHEGVDHSNEGGHGAEPQHAHSDKIACAELEGAADAGGATAETDVPTIVVRDGEPVGGVAEIAVGAGDDVRFKVTSDQAEEIHVHGYDLAQDVPAGGTIEFDFPADLEGIYEVELEELGTQIAELRVEP